MDSQTPLRHIVAPGEYAVQWAVPADGRATTPVQGSITLAPRMPPQGSMIFEGVPITWHSTGPSRSAGFPQHYQYGLLRGRMATNHAIYLIDARVETWEQDHAILQARCALVGLPASEVGETFDSVRIQTTFLDRLASVAPIDATRFPQAGQPIEWWARQSADLEQKWTSASATLRLGFDCRARTHDPYEVHVRYSPVVTIDLNTPTRLDDIVADWIDPLKGIATVAMGAKSDITFVALAPVTGEQDDAARSLRVNYLQLYGTGLAQAPYAAAPRAPGDLRPALTFGTSGSSLLSVLEGWQRHTSGSHPLFETYVSVLGVPDDHPRSRYLLLLQALEGHYGHVNKANIARRVRAHTAKREGHLQSVLGSADLDDQTKKFIKRHLAKQPPMGLDVALQWAAKSLPDDVGDRISKSELVQQVINQGRASDWANALRVVRNDLSHGDRGYDAWLLHDVSQVLDRMVRAHVLRSVDADDDVLSRILSTSDS